MTAGREPPLILLLDDDVPWLRSLRRLLVREGFSVLAFTEPAQILAAVTASKPTLIVLDYVLPTTNGAAVAREIRKGPCEAPIVLVSSSLASLDADELEPFDDAIDKAIDSSRMIERLRAFVVPDRSRRSGTRMRAHVNADLEAARRRGS